MVDGNCKRTQYPKLNKTTHKHKLSKQAQVARSVAGVVPKEVLATAAAAAEQIWKSVISNTVVEQRLTALPSTSVIIDRQQCKVGGMHVFHHIARSPS